jgi:hypothetical protein
MRAAAIVVALAACGRIDFKELGPTANGGVLVTLQLDRVTPTMDLADYVLPVVLDDSRIDRTRLSANASDLEFFDSTGADLGLEIEQIGAAGGAPLIAWVKVPTISGLTTTIDMRYATPRDVPAQTPWDSTYDVVYHFANGDGHDSTGAHDATNMGAVAAPGVLGNGAAFTGSQYLAVSPSAAIAKGSFTVEGWVNMTTLPSGFYALLAREFGTGTDDDVYLGVQGAMGVVTCEQAGVEIDAGGGALTAGNWVYLAGTAHAMKVTLFIEGTMIANTPTGSTLQHSTSPLFIGADSNGGGTTPQNDFMMGTIDELRISSTIRPNYWLKYSAAAFRDQVISYP